MRTHATAIIILSSHLILFSLLNNLINPHPDMLDHWVWSQHLFLSYYEHPPMVAWAIRLFTTFAGNSETALEFAALFYNLLVLALSYGICYLLFGIRAAVFYLIILESTPYFFIGSVFLHIDQPFLVFWLLNLYFLCRFHKTHAKRWLILIGVTAGLGALSKYITILFYLGALIHLLSYKDQRHHLKNPWIYFAGFISLLIFTPVLIWNFQNDWISFRFQIGRGLSATPSAKSFILFSVGHLVLFSIVWSWWSIYQVWRSRRELLPGWRDKSKYPESIIVILSAVPFIFFSMASFHGTIADPHWLNVSYLGLMMLSGKTLSQTWELHRAEIRKPFSLSTGTIKILAGGGLFVNIAVLVFVFWHVKQPLVEFPQYQIKDFHSFARYGISQEVTGKLQVLKNEPLLTRDEFLGRLQHALSKEELQLYRERILKIAIHPHYDRITPVTAWKETGDQLTALLQKKGIKSVDFIVSREYQLSSAVSFFLPDHPLPHTVEKPERNQWSRLEDLSDKQGVILCRIQSCGRVLEWSRNDLKREPIRWGELEIVKNNRLVRLLEVYGFE